MNQAVAEEILTCKCGDCGCEACRSLLTQADVKIAAFEEAAQIAETVAKEYGPMTSHACRMVAQRIRAEMALVQESA